MALPHNPTPGEVATADQKMTWAQRTVDTLVTHVQADRRTGLQRFIATAMNAAEPVALETDEGDELSGALAIIAAAVIQLADLTE